MNINLDKIPDSILGRLEEFAGQLLALAKTGQEILDLISTEMGVEGADEDTLKELAGAIVHAIDGFDIEMSEEDQQKLS